MALALFARAYPEIRVRIVDDTSRGITARVVRGEVDFGVGTVVGSAPGVSATPWLTTPLGLLAHADHHSQALTGAKWAAKSRMSLAGTSEGAVAVARHDGSAFAGSMIYSWSCEPNYFVESSRTAVVSKQPVSNVISAVDPYFLFGPCVARQLAAARSLRGGPSYAA